jgi:ATP/maltotriose-dependent transcriptional regulator MalT
VAICEQIGWTLRVVEQLLLCGEVALAQDAPDEARTHFEDARARAQHMGDDRLLTFALCGLGNAALADRDLGRARSIYRQALEIAEEDGRDELRCRAIVGLAMLERREGHLQPAMALVARADRILRDPQPPIPDLLTASWMDVRIRTSQLYAELQRQMPPQRLGDG